MLIGMSRSSLVFSGGLMKTRIAGILACALVALVAGRAGAQTTTEDSEKYIRVIQQKPFVKAMRFEMELTFNIPLNEVYTRHLGEGLQLRFHINDWAAVGLDYMQFHGWDTNLGEEVSDAWSVYPMHSKYLDFYVGAHASFVPVSGKSLWLGDSGSPVYWDVYFVVGAGVFRTGAYNWWQENTEDVVSGMKGSGNFGIGWRIAATSWLTVNFEVRDYMFMENYGDDDRFVNNVVFTAGLGFFVPKHDYVYPK